MGLLLPSQTILGHGIDNHLLGLRETAEDLGLPTPEVFKDEVYGMSNHFTLSTSHPSIVLTVAQAPSPLLNLFLGANHTDFTP